MATALRADIIAHRPNGALAAIVEVKNREGLDRQAASALRENMISRGALPEVPFFMIASQEKAYLWTDGQPGNGSADPDVELDIKKALSDYIPRDISGRLHRDELEFIIYNWLLDLALAERTPENEAENALVKAGFVDAIRGATLDRDVA
jgi:hypothetical protein